MIAKTSVSAAKQSLRDHDLLCRMTDDISAGKPLTFGLVGTGHWARVAHARALASVPEIKFAAVWGRNTEAAAGLAAEFGITAHVDFEAFLAEVDGVAFSVPPDVQSELAVLAARAGKHVLLEKPVALTETAADALVRAVDEAAVASVVFFTARFQSDARAWLEEVVAGGGWQGASALWLGAALDEASPFNTPWRRAKGGLWDLGPHVLSLLWPILGPVETVTADAGRGDLTHLVLHHHGGATSTATVTLGAPEAADDGFDLQVWGTRGRSAVPHLAADPVPALQVALTELVASARSGSRGHPCDVRFGRDVTRVLAQAQRHLDAARLAENPA
jgi:predicted dehydrogenase